MTRVLAFAPRPLLKPWSLGTDGSPAASSWSNGSRSWVAATSVGCVTLQHGQKGPRAVRQRAFGMNHRPQRPGDWGAAGAELI